MVPGAPGASSGDVPTTGCLKDNFYEKAYGLVGVYRDRAIECSRTVTLDLEKVVAEPDDDEDDE